MKSITIESLERTDKDKVLVVDIRPEDQYQRGTFPGAVNLPMAEFEDRKTELELYKDKEKERFQKFIAQNQKYLENEDFWEFEALQIFINDNPFDQAYKYMSKQFQDVEDGDDCTVVAVIAKVDKKKDKNKKTFAYVNLYSSFGLTEAIVWHSQLKEYEDMIVKGNQIAMLCRKDSDEKVIAKKIKPYKQWLEDIKKVKGVVA